jgi:predicted nucleic acid-binding protein
MIKIFFDANILIDISDSSRSSYEESKILLDYLMDNIEQYTFYTSCDLMTTVYYILRKKLTKEETLSQIKLMNELINVIEFGNKEVAEAIELMERNKKYIDLEDTIQYVMARKEKCDYIITNDKNFASGDVPVLSSKEALKELNEN